MPIREDERRPARGKVQASYANFVWGLPPSTDPLYPSVGISTPEQKSGERYKVIMVGKESPAAAAGFQVGDELVSIDGVAYTDKETVNRLMAGKRWGDAVDYKVMRNGQEQALTVHLRRQPPKPRCPRRRRRRRVRGRPVAAPSLVAALAGGASSPRPHGPRRRRPAPERAASRRACATRSR